MIGPNQDVKRAARAAAVPLWRIAAELHISEPTLTRKLRFPLSTEMREEIMGLIPMLEKREVDNNGE